MTTIRLVHWNADEAAARTKALERAGFIVQYSEKIDGAVMRELRAAPPAAFVIDLTRLPSHGKEVAAAVMASAALRTVPVVFAGGESAKVAALRAAFPSALFVDWEECAKEVKAAIARGPVAVRAAAGAGYSGTPLPKKLGIKAGMRAGIVNAPAEFIKIATPMPEGAEFVNFTFEKKNNECGIVIIFVKNRAELTAAAARMRARKDYQSVWFAWPKKASGVITDISDAEVRAAGLGAGLVDFKVCAIDATWSGLHFARKNRNGPGI